MPSFNIVNELDLQEVDNAVNQAVQVISQRFDFRGTHSEIKFDRNSKTINMISNNEQKIETILDILQSKAHKRGIDIKALQAGKATPMSGDLLKATITLVDGIDKETAKKITKHIKGLKYRVQASIEDDKLRVTGKKRDDLQNVIQNLKENNFEVPLQFTNFRD